MNDIKFLRIAYTFYYFSLKSMNLKDLYYKFILKNGLINH